MADYEYTSDLDISSIKKRLDQAAKEFNQFADKADKAFGKIQKEADEAGKRTRKTGEAAGKAGKQMADGAKISGAALGVTSGIVQELTRRFVDLAVKAVTALADIAKGGVELNKNLETAERVFGAAFGDPNLGKEVLKFLDETAEKLNIDKGLAVAFGQSILPKTDSLDSFVELLRLTDIQADTTGKSVGELEFAIREALSGDFVSLKDQFDISTAQVNRIKELTPTLGASAALAQVLGEEFERLGKVNITGTLQTDTKAVQANLTDLQIALGKPVFDELKEQISGLGTVLNEREDDFELVAAAFGDVVANVVDFIGSGLTDFLENLDTEQAIAIADNLFDAVEAGRSLADALGLLELPADLLDGLETVTKKLGEIFTTATQITGLAQAQEAKAKAASAKAAELAGFGVKDPTDRSGPDRLNPAIASLFLTAEQNAEVAAAGERAYQEELLKTVEILEESKDRQDQLRETQKQRREDQEADRPANRAALDDILKTRAAEDEATEAAEDYAEAQDKIQDAHDKFNTEAARDELDLLIKAERAALDAALDAARKREDLARKNLQRISDIQAESEQAFQDAATESGRGEEDQGRESARRSADIERSAAQRQADIARQAAQKRLDIETDYRRKLEDIRTQFERSAVEAERSRDAIAFLRARDERDQAIQDAGTERNRGLADVGTQEGRDREQAAQDAEREREEARINDEREREDARIAEERKLEDLRLALERKLEEQRLANERELEEARLAEERKAEDLALANEQAAEDLKTAQERKKEDLAKSLEEETALVKKYEAQKTATFKIESERRIAQARKEADEMRRLSQQSASGTQATGNPLTGGPTRRAAGGPVAPGADYLVGERGPELFSPNVPGRITPNRSASPVPAPANLSRVVDNSIRNSNEFQLSDPSQLSLTQRAMIQNMITEAQAAANRGRRAGVR